MPTPLSLLQQALVDRDDLQVRFIAPEVPVAQRARIIQDRCQADDAEALNWMGVRLTEEWFNLAVEKGALTVIRQELPHLPQTAWWENNTGLIKAVRSGDAHMVSMLANISRPNAQSATALVEAIRKGRDDLVELLLPVADLAYRDALPLREALLQGHYGILARLATLSNAAVAGEALIRAVTVTDPRQANPGQFTDEQRWAAVDYLGAHVDAPQRHRWLASHGDTKLPGIARQVLTDLRLRTLDERPVTVRPPRARRRS